MVNVVSSQAQLSDASILNLKTIDIY
jgi:hypothetical protein